MRKRGRVRIVGYLALLMGLRVGICSADVNEVRIISPHWEGYKKEFESAFTEWHKSRFGAAVKVRWLDVGGTSDILRYLIAQSKRGEEDLGADMLFGGGIDPFLELKRQGLLVSVAIPEEIDNFLPPSVQGNRIHDDEGYWHSVNLSGFGIVYNRILVSRRGLSPPRTWSDLTRPEYRGWVGSPDPRKSGSIRFVYELILQYVGWEEGWRVIYGIASHSRVFSTHSSQTPKDITAGEIVAGPLIDSYAREIQRTYGTELVGYVVPRDIPSVFGDAIGVLRGARNVSLATRFIEFSLSLPAQLLLMRKAGAPGGPRHHTIARLSVRPDAYGHEGILEDLENPFISPAMQRPYDFTKASERWHVVTALLGAVAVDSAERLRVLASEDPHAVSRLPAPLSEEEVSHIGKSGRWKDPATRERDLSRIKHEFQKLLPPDPTPWGWWFGVTIFVGLVLLGRSLLRGIQQLKRKGG